MSGTSLDFLPCGYRTSLDSQGNVHTCAHPNVRVDNGIVVPEVCFNCRYRSIQAAIPRSTRSQDLEQHKKSEWKWSVGVTTAPRRAATLERFLISLRAAGWDSVRIFAEPGAEIPTDFEHVPTTRRQTTLGAFPNWFLGLTELVMREPETSAFFMCEDDVIFSVGLRAYLESQLWPTANVGVISPYCPSHVGLSKPWGFHAENRGWNTWGALAYIFPNSSARALITDSLVVNHRHHGPRDGLQDMDSVVGNWCARTARSYFVHVPSLAEHIGATSTIYPHASNRGWRRANHFVSRIDLEKYSGRE